MNPINPINYQAFKTQVKATAQEARTAVKQGINTVTESSTFQGTKSDITTGAKNLETKVIEPAFNTITKETTRLVNEYKEPVTQIVKKAGSKLGEVFRLLK